jgi:hypothetical protein
MDLSTGIALAIVLCIALWIPYFFLEIRKGKARGHTWFTWWKPRGHPDTGPDLDLKKMTTDEVFRQTRPGADDARGAHY